MSTSLSRATNILFSIAFSAFLKNSHLSTSTSIKSKCKVPPRSSAQHPCSALLMAWSPSMQQVWVCQGNPEIFCSNPDCQPFDKSAFSVSIDSSWPLQAFWLSRGALIGWSCRHFLIVADTSECIAYTVQTERSGKSLQSFTLSLTSRLNSGSGSSDLGDIRN